MTSEQLDAVIAAIDAANARDPTMADDGATPAALAYGRRMSAALDELSPSASALLRIAVRGQHIERWTLPRSSHPEGRAGYLAWRAALQGFHAQRLATLMQAAGCAAAETERVGALVRKERIKQDAELQALEDCACLVFLRHDLDAFMAKIDEEDLSRILAKTWRKMSSQGHALALRLSLPPRVTAMVGAMVASR